MFANRRFRTLFLASAALTGLPVAQAYAQTSAPADAPAAVGEIIVTAEKRETRLSDTPVPITVVNTAKLATTGQTELRDFFSTVPGLGFQASYESSQSLDIRGIATGSGAYTVGVTVDDVPFGVSGSSFVPDLDPGDLERIEVLRGPQGTLYGTNSMGGLVKYVTKDPSTQGFSGKVEGGLSGVYNGAEPGYSARGSANIPLSDTFAFRISGFERQDPGYIDDPTLGAKGVNQVNSDGSRITALWKPTGDFSLKLSGLYQNTRAMGNSDVDIQHGLGDLQQSYVREAGRDDHVAKIFSADINYTLGPVKLTSITAYTVDSFSNWLDGTQSSGTVPQAMGVNGAALFTHHNDTAITEEFRAAVKLTDKMDWLLGGFVSSSRADGNYQTDFAVDAATGRIAGVVAHFPAASSGGEQAVFTNLTYRFTDRFDVQVGARESWLQQDVPGTVYTGPLFGAAGVSPVTASSAKSEAFTYLFTPRFKLSQDVMVYARLSSGFRPGGGNTIAGFPAQYAPDQTKNYEVGLKGGFLDNRITVDASLYHIDWTGIQLTVRSPLSLPYIVNGGSAKSDGGELAVQTHPIAGMTIGGWIAYDNAVLTQNLPANGTLFGRAGNKLPFSAPFTSSISAEQTFPLLNDAVGFVGGQVDYIDTRDSTFQATATRTIYPAYTQADLRAGVRRGTWALNVYANNVTDTRGVIGGGLGFRPTNALVYITPRTVGATLSKTF
jgi:iron complex outermembrane receptor protein